MLSNVNIEKYLAKHYGLWLDLRSTDDNFLQGTGRTIQNANEGITIQFTKKADTKNPINIYILYKTLKSTSKMGASKKHYIRQPDFPKYPHCVVIYGQTGCGKTEYVLDLLEKEYRGVFDNLVIL